MATIICMWMFICMYVCFFTELENKWEVKIYIFEGAIFKRTIGIISKKSIKSVK